MENSNEKDVLIRKNQDIVLRHIHDVFYLIDIHANYYDDECYLYEINEIGVFIWENIECVCNIYELAKMLQEQMNEDVDISILQEDINNFVNVLYNEGFIEKVK